MSASHEKAMDGSLSTVDDVLRKLACQKSHAPLVGFPVSEPGANDAKYDEFSADQLTRLVDAASADFVRSGLHMPDLNVAPVVGLLGMSSLDYLIAMLALSRMGFSVLVLSPRLSTEALVSLMDDADCSIVVNPTNFNDVVEKAQQARQLTQYTLPCRSKYDYLAQDDGNQLLNDVQRTVTSASKIAYILHSSGSTSSPKLIFITHQAGLGTFAANPNSSRALCTVPLYHMHGHSTLYRTFYGGGSIFFLDPNRAVTTSTLLSAMENIRPEVVYTVPYTLKMLAESSKGIDMMKSCRTISVSGSQCPDELGDRVVKQGIHLVSFFGTTETGGIMSSARPREDKAWNYLRLPKHVKPFIFMKKLDPTTYELVVLDGHKSKVMSNSDDPPNSFHSRDIFTPHLTIPDAWKYLGRLDDRVTLLNGEKVLPLPIEGLIRQHPLVKEAVVFGIGKSVPGLLLFKNQTAQKVSDEEFISQLWPTIAKANSAAESFSQIGREMIIPLPPDVEYPRTDKGTIIRAKVYNVFAEAIEAIYSTDGEKSSQDQLRLNEKEAVFYMRGILKDDFGLDLKDTSDFFAAGVDSLMAIQLARRIKKDVYLGEDPPSMDQNTIYEKGSIRGLASYIDELQTGESKGLAESPSQTIANLIGLYSKFTPHKSYPRTSPANTVLLTGATGSLGSHIIAYLLNRQDVDQIFCLTRDKSVKAADRRVKETLQAKRLDIPQASLRKITALPADMSAATLGLNSETLEAIRSSLILIIHCAWAVNFNVGVRSFEEQHIKGAHNLISLSLSVKLPLPARFVFCSSISVASGLSTEASVPEDIVGDLHHLPANGYGQSKYVTENIVRNARAQGADGLVLRIGQIVGDSRLGLWNTSEAVPLLIRTADSLRCLPCLDETCSWLPVDFAAKTVLEIADHADDKRDSVVYNVLNPSIFHWTRDLLPALRDSGLKFDAVKTQEWLQRLRDGEQDPTINPSVKLMSFWEQAYSGTNNSRGLKFSTDVAERTSVTLRNVPDLIQNGYISRFVEAWRREWHKQ